MLCTVDNSTHFVIMLVTHGRQIVFIEHLPYMYLETYLARLEHL
jgi:hypothetical protein